MTYRKHKNDLIVNWALLGEYGWEIDEYGVEAGDLDPAGESMCHLDRTTLHIIAGGYSPFLVARFRELADAGVPGLEHWRTWQACFGGMTPFTADTTRWASF